MVREVLGSESVPTAESEGEMKKIGMVLAALASVVATSSANAAFSDCSSIADPGKRLACYDKAANAAARSAKPAAVNPVWGATPNAISAKPIPILKAAPVDPRFWFEAEGGFYGSMRNVGTIGPVAPSTLVFPVPTSPGFIGQYQTSTASQAPNGAPTSLGGGASFGWGQWLDPQHTTAIQGSAFFGLGYSKPASPQSLTTSNFINTTPDVFVGLFNDTTTATTGGIWDLIYGVDGNYRMAVPHFPYFTNFDVLIGWRYVGLDEFTTSSSSVLTRNYQQALGLPAPFNLPLVDSSSPRWYGISNNFIGPQIGFNAKQNWGPYWVESENKVAVGPTIELGASGPTVHNLTPATSIQLAGIPLGVNAGLPTFTQTSGPTVRVKAAFTVVPSGNLKFGYDIIPDQRSLTLSYNYLYMSDVGLIAAQFPSPVSIRQSSYFMQGITLGYREKF
jgi:hypothetical protein